MVLREMSRPAAFERRIDSYNRLSIDMGEERIVNVTRPKEPRLRLDPESHKQLRN